LLSSSWGTRHRGTLYQSERELAEDLPHVIGDRVQLQQVLKNLIVNGVTRSLAKRPPTFSTDLAIVEHPSLHLVL
jgi:phosphoglycerate-specific signal transduction histidine kinase